VIGYERAIVWVGKEDLSCHHSVVCGGAGVQIFLKEGHAHFLSVLISSWRSACVFLLNLFSDVMGEMTARSFVMDR